MAQPREHIYPMATFVVSPDQTAIVAAEYILTSDPAGAEKVLLESFKAHYPTEKGWLHHLVTVSRKPVPDQDLRTALPNPPKSVAVRQQKAQQADEVSRQRAKNAARRKQGARDRTNGG